VESLLVEEVAKEFGAGKGLIALRTRED